ncbi:MAG: ankyrin repeat domain-containing protein [Actinomycetes bacterium]
MSHGDYKDFFRGACDGDLELVRHYLRHGVDVDFIHPELQSTALVAAIGAGRVEVALVLLDHGADPALRSPLEGMAPFAAAEAAGLAEVAAWLRASPGEPTTTPPGR